MSLIFPKKEILYAPMLGTLGGGSARGFGRGGGGKRKDPLTMVYNGSNWDLVDDILVVGDIIYFHQGTVSGFVFPEPASDVTQIQFAVVGAGGSTTSDGGGWCSSGGGGGGGGVTGYLQTNDFTGSNNQYYISVGAGGAGRIGTSGDSGTNRASDGAQTRLANQIHGADAIGYGGKGGTFCEISSTNNQYSGGYGGGTFYASLGTNASWSNGGNGGLGNYNDGQEPATGGGSSAYGGGGGGGSHDGSSGGSTAGTSGGNSLTHSSLSWISPSGKGGDGDGRGTARNRVPTANRGGGSGGVAYTANGNSQVQSEDGADGLVAFRVM